MFLLVLPLLAPQSSIAPDTLGWRFEPVHAWTELIPWEDMESGGSREATFLGRRPDQDGDGRSEFVFGVRVPDPGGHVLYTVHTTQGSFERYIDAFDTEWRTDEMRGRETLPPGRFANPAWEPSGSFGRSWIPIDVDGDGVDERLVADPGYLSPGMHSSGETRPGGAIHVFRSDGTLLATRVHGLGREQGADVDHQRGLGQRLARIDDAGDGVPARCAVSDARGNIFVFDLVPRDALDHTWPGVRLSRRNYPCWLGEWPVGDLQVFDGEEHPEYTFRDDVLTSPRELRGLSFVEHPQALVLWKFDLRTSGVDGVPPMETRAFDGLWVTGGTPGADRSRGLRAAVGEDALLVADGELGPDEAYYFNGVQLTWHAAQESVRTFQHRLLDWEERLHEPLVITVHFDGAGLDEDEARLRWTWLLARHDGFVSGLPSDLPAGRLGRPVEGWMHDESGTIYRDFERGRIVSTAEAWARTRVRMDGPHRSLFTGELAWEHIFLPGTCDVLLDVSTGE